MRGAARPSPRPRRRAAFALAVGSLLSAAGLVGAFGFVAACGSDVAEDPSYLLVELAPVDVPQRPIAAAVSIAKGGTEIGKLCVRLGDEPASFVLKRDPGKPASDRITIEVRSFVMLSGADNAAPGKEFACPAVLPPSVSDVQSVETDFCEAESHKLVFRVGSVCGCDDMPDGGVGDGGDADGGDAGMSDAGMSDAGMSDAGVSDAGDMDGGDDGGVPDAGPPPCGCGVGLTCGAGLDSTGQACAASTCCSARVSSACVLGG